MSKFVSKKSKLPILPENWQTKYLRDADSSSDISFLNIEYWIYFWVFLGWKSQMCLLACKQAHTHAHTHTHTHTHAHPHTHTYTHTHTHTYTHAQTLSQGCYVYSEIRLVSRKLDSPLCLEAFTQTVDVIVRSHWNVWKQR